MKNNSKPQPTYKLIKLTIGVCSVTLMALFAGRASVAHADEATPTATVVSDTATTGETAATDTSEPTTTNAETPEMTATNSAPAETVSAATNDSSTTPSSTVAEPTEADINNLSIPEDDKNTAIAYLSKATDAQKADMATSIVHLNGWTVNNRGDGKYELTIEDQNKSKFTEDIILPTVGDLKNIGLNADELYIYDYTTKGLGNANIKTISTSKAGGKLKILAFYSSKSLGIFGKTLYNIVSIDLSNLDTSAVKSMNGWFGFYTTMKELNLSGFDTSNVTDMANMFYFCVQLKNLDLSSFDTRNVTDMTGMFEECHQLQNLDLSSFDTSEVTNMFRMFSKCIALESLNVSSFNTQNVTNMQDMFFVFRSLKSLDLSNFDMSNVKNSLDMFGTSYTYADQQIIISNLLNTVTNDGDGGLLRAYKSFIVGPADKVTSDMKYDPYQPKFYYMNGNTRREIKVKVPTIVSDPIKDFSDYIKPYMDTAVSDAGYAYKTTPTTYSLDSYIEVMPIHKDATIPTKWAVVTNDGKVVLGNSTTTTVKNGMDWVPGTADTEGKYVINWDTVSGAFNSNATTTTENASGTKVDYTTLSANVIGDNNGTVYKNDVDLINKFNTAKSFVTGNYKTATRPNVSGVTINDDGTVTAVSHGITLTGKFEWKKMADEANVTVKETVTFEDGDTPKPADMVTSELPPNATPTWEKTPTADDPTGVIRVTFEDGTYVDNPVKANIYKLGDPLTAENEASLYKDLDPEDLPYKVAEEVKYPEGKLPPAKDLVTEDLPTGAVPIWQKEPTPEDPNGTIRITFGDDSYIDYPVKAYIYKFGYPLTAENEASLYKDIDPDDRDYQVPTTIKYPEGQLPPADKVVIGDLPTGAVPTWEKEPTPEDPDGTIRITFEDGSYIDYPVKAYIYKLGDPLTATEADLYKDLDPDDLPYKVVGEIKYPEGQLPPAEDLVAGELPEGAVPTWQKEPTPEDPTGTIRIKFGDDSYIDYPVKAKIYSHGEGLTRTEADLYKDLDPEDMPYKVAEEVKFPEGKLPPAGDLVTGDLPLGAVPTWVKEPTPEDPTGTIRIKFGDDSYIDYHVKAKIYKHGEALTRTEADLYKDLDPEDLPYKVADEVKYPEGQLPPAADLVSGELPAGAVPSWTKEPTLEDPTGTIRITFGDGTYIDYPVKAKIYSHGEALTRTEADMYTIEPKDGVTVPVGGELKPGDVIANIGDLPGDAKVTITGFDKDTLGDQTVTVTVTFADGSTLTMTVVVNVVAAEATTADVTDGAGQVTTTAARTNAGTEAKLPQTGNVKGLAWLGAMLLPLGLLGAVKKRKN